MKTNILKIHKKTITRKPRLPVQEQTALRAFKNLLARKLGVNISEVRLFGSKARGDWHKGSDIDVMVILKKGGSKNESLVLDIATEILLNYGINLSVHIYSEKQVRYLNSIPTVFFQLVNRDSKRL